MSKRKPNTYDVICEALRLAPVHEYPSKLAHILQAEGKTADLPIEAVIFIARQAIRMSGKKDFRKKAKWILELTGDLHIVDNPSGKDLKEAKEWEIIGQSKNIQG